MEFNKDMIVNGNAMNGWEIFVGTRNMQNFAKMNFMRRGMIRLRRIYNFLLFHANILQLSYTFGNFLYYFWD